MAELAVKAAVAALAEWDFSEAEASAAAGTTQEDGDLGCALGTIAD